ncbi:ABC transporter ATP-binding protein [Neoactinobaculum massilliense]|uniref:ABC transporter ATP-binding protein n=1 Tax=Neoactinobaculum massilliense TaxID=2364794 RepID=UPI000F523525|nr:ABC transporter ATP-binding protein [Neoactinobaculum massilliense]
MAESRPTIVEIYDVAKKFTVHKDKSLKERLVNAGRSRAHAEEYWALNGIDLTIRAGESIGLAGPNGSGKSTLLKVIGGILTPDRGSVKIRGRLAALLELGAGFHPDLTGRENIYLNGAVLGLSEQEIDAAYDSIVDFAGIGDFIDTQVKFYSSGMYVRLAFAVAVHSNPDILLVDEVLAVGDEAFQRKCMDKIREFQSQGRTIILVSHSAQQIIDVCDRAVVLNHGRVVAEGEVHEAMSVLHEGYAAIENAGPAAPTQAPEASGVSLGGAQVLDGQGKALPESVLTPAETLRVEVPVNTDHVIEAPKLSLRLVSTEGVEVFGADTGTLGVVLDTVRDGSRIRVDLPHVALGDGDYTVSVRLLAPDGVELARLAEEPRFSVRSAVRTTGYVHVEPEFSIME